MITINQLRLDGGTQSRAALNEATVAEYAEAMADPNTVFPPVTVYFDGRDHWLADGFHRVAAWQRIGREEVPAEVRQGDRRRAILHSVAANSNHGLRRTNEDKRRAVLTLLEDEEWRTWSDRAIADACRVDHKTVGRIRAEHLGNSPDSEVRTVERGGTVYQQNTARIGKPEAAPSPADDEPRQAPPSVRAVEPVAAPHALKEPAIAAPAIDPAEAKLRRDLAKLTPEALIDDVVGLRAQIAEERARRRKVEAERDDLKDQIAALTAEGDMGRKLGIALQEIQKVKGRLGEVQAQLARETRRANAMEKARDELQRRIEAQIIPMDGAA
jgi:hypothetical protein